MTFRDSLIAEGAWGKGFRSRTQLLGENIVRAKTGGFPPRSCRVRVTSSPGLDLVWSASLMADLGRGSGQVGSSNLRVSKEADYDRLCK